MSVERYRSRVYNRYVLSHETYAMGWETRSDVPALHLVSFVNRVFPADRDSRILDIGCGSGDLLIAAKHVGYCNVRGVDAADDQVRLAHKRGLDEVTKAEVSQYLADVADGSLDCIIAYDLIEHFDRNELFDLCDLIFTKLSHYGSFIVHTANAEGLFGLRMRYGDLTHELAFTPASLTQLWRLVGFSSFKCYPDRPTVHNITSATRYIIWIAVETALRICLGAETGRLDGIFTQNLFAVASKGGH
jgi:2-polyprenyl-3-methyl-5-hydroxy-6-metoxy-1,4-benzoquinol methylase